MLPISTSRCSPCHPITAVHRSFRKFYEQHGIKNLAVLLDPQGQAMRAFKARGVPTTYIIDTRGLMQAYAEGAEDWGTDPAAKRVTELAST